MTSADQRSRRRRRAIGAVLVIALLLALLGGLLALQPGPSLRAGLWLSGHDEITFDQLRVGLNRLELTGLEIGGTAGNRVGRLQIEYRPRDLVRGRIAEVSVEGLTLRGRIDEDGFGLEGLDPTAAGADETPGLPPLPIPDRVAIRDARLELATPVGALAVPFAAELRPEEHRSVFVLDVDQAHLAAADGQLTVVMHLEGETPLSPEQMAADPQRLAAELTASARVDLRANALGLPGVAQGVEGQGKLAFAWEHGQLDASLANLRVELAQLAPEWSEIAALMPTPWLVELKQPAGIAASLIADKILIEGHGGIAVASAGPRLSTAASMVLTLDRNGDLRELVVPDAEIGLRDLRVAGMRLERGSIRLDGSGTPASWQGDLTLELHGAGEPRPGLTLEGASARAGLDARFADGRLSLLMRDPGALRLEHLTFADQARLNDLELQWQSSTVPLLTADFADGDIAWQQRLSARMPELQATIEAGGTPVALTGDIRQLDVELAGEGADIDGGRITLADGVVRLPAHDLVLSGIAGEIALAADGMIAERAIPVAIGSVVHEGKPAWFAPLRLEGSVQPRGDQIAFDVEVARAAGGVEVQVVGEHDLASGQGRAQLELPPVDFAPGDLQPGGLTPLLADLAEDVSGRLALDGSVRWGAGAGVGADLDLLVENLAFTSGPARFEQVNGVIALDRLVPLSTPPGQQLAVGLVDLGLPLTNGLLTFQLEPGRLAVEQLRWRFAEGRIRAAPFTIGSGPMRFATTLTAERLSLDEIFTLTQLDGLTGKGTMHGTLPITVDGANAVIQDGELVSDGPGWVRYRPGQAPAALQAGGENVNLLLQALENFHYEELRLTVDGRTDAEMDVGLHIAGANPELYDGYPIEFNLNLEGALGNLLRSGLATYQIPDRVREQMQGFGR